MNLCILLQQPHLKASGTALHYTLAAAESHVVRLVFFQFDAVYVGLPHREESALGAHCLQTEWKNLQQQHSLDLILCQGSLERRGLEKNELAAGFRMGGYGELIQQLMHCDRCVCF